MRVMQAQTAAQTGLVWACVDKLVPRQAGNGAVSGELRSVLNTGMRWKLLASTPSPPHFIYRNWELDSVSVPDPYSA